MELQQVHFALYNPFIAEHILGKSGMTEDVVLAEINSVLAVPLMAYAQPC